MTPTRPILAAPNCRPRPDLSEAHFKIDGQPCRLIALTQGFFVIIDEDDYERVSPYAWCVARRRGINNYAVRRTKSPEGKSIVVLLHSIILPRQEGLEIDHRNRCGLDNRKSNLRYATRMQNGRNFPLPRSNTSGVKGVYWRANRWEARIRIGGKGSLYLGRFRSLEDARAAYNGAAIKYHGEFACLA